MNYIMWLKNNAENLSGKTVAITGSTGGLGKEICEYLAVLNKRDLLLQQELLLHSKGFQDLHL